MEKKAGGTTVPDKQVTSPAYLAKILQERGLAPRRSQGQHFLVDDNIRERILAAASLDGGDYVLDIGAGPGALSLAMAERVAGVIAIEQDRGLVELLEEQAAMRGLDGLQVVEGDVRRLNLEEICRERWGPALGRNVEKRNIKVVANLPYYLTTPLLFQLLQSRLPLKLLVLMVQLEVARRINAEAGQKDYGLLTVLCRYYTNPRFLFKVSRGVFYPRPAVDSAVVLLEAGARPNVEIPREDLFWKIVRAAFQKRRKTILNALEGVEMLEKAEWAKLLKKAGIQPGCRGETLKLAEFAKLSEILYNKSVP
jgi:16S rRNA (adenine1518-N6/adenine1519-N6)-dimethyltransferase